VFVAVDGLAVQRQIDIARNNGTQAQVRSGLKEGDRVVIYPSAAIRSGSAIAQRVLE
jgi:HlyD family secretion protein